MPYIGIDLGTTNSCIAIAHYTHAGGVTKETLTILQRREQRSSVQQEHMPSYIYINQDGTALIGQGAKEKDEQMRNLGENRALRLFKKHMGLENVIYTIGNQTYTPVSASAMILKQCGNAYNAYGMLHNHGGQITYQTSATTITCPACFGKDAKEDTLKAAQEAKFSQNIKMLAEPNAALLAYIHNETQRGLLDLSEKKRFITVDLGGGTCDVVIIDVQTTQENGKNNLIFEPIGTPNRGDLGGSDFDTALAVLIVKKFIDDNHLDLNTQDEDYKKLVSQAFAWAERAKESLSNALRDALYTALAETGETISENSIRTHISQLNPFHIHIPNLYDGHDFDYDLSLQEYLEIVDHLIYKRTEQYITNEERLANKNMEEILFETMEGCNCEKKDIDYVFFTGGMSYFWPLRLALAGLLGKQIRDIKIPDNPLTAVAEGAALYTLFKEAERLNDQGPDLIHVENIAYMLPQSEQQGIQQNNQIIKMPTSIGKTYMLERKDKLPFVLIEKSTTYPTQRTRIQEPFRTTAEMGILINIFFGTSLYNSDIEMARSLKKEFDEPKAIGTPFNIDYEIDDSGIPIFYIVFNENEEYIVGGISND